jgi:hypothetical protein
MNDLILKAVTHFYVNNLPFWVFRNWLSNFMRGQSGVDNHFGWANMTLADKYGETDEEKYLFVHGSLEKLTA